MQVLRVAMLGALSVAFSSCGGGGTGAVQPAAGQPVPSIGPVVSNPPSPAPPNQSPPPASGSSVNVSPYDPNQGSSTGSITVSISPASGAALTTAQLGSVHIDAVAGKSPPLNLSAKRRPFSVRRPSVVTNSPFDVNYYGGAVIGGAQQHAILISTNLQNCNVDPSASSTCWGVPGTNQTDLGASSFVNSILGQYMNGLNQLNRYPRGTQAFVTLSVVAPHPGVQNPVIDESDLLLTAYNVASQLGFGYGHIYHLFLPPNTDTCFDQTSECYSPDNPNSFFFCAYHSSVTIGGQKLVYTVEPYQDVAGCGFTGGVNTVNGDDVIDSTMNTLTHELMETLSDPDVGSGWLNPSGDEIADICVGHLTTVNMNGNNYTVQSIWSNAIHLCTDG